MRPVRAAQETHKRQQVAVHKSAVRVAGAVAHMRAVRATVERNIGAAAENDDDDGAGGARRSQCSVAEEEQWDTRIGSPQAELR